MFAISPDWPARTQLCCSRRMAAACSRPIPDTRRLPSHTAGTEFRSCPRRISRHKRAAPVWLSLKFRECWLQCSLRLGWLSYSHLHWSWLYLWELAARLACRAAVPDGWDRLHRETPLAAHLKLAPALSLAEYCRRGSAWNSKAQTNWTAKLLAWAGRYRRPISAAHCCSLWNSRCRTESNSRPRWKLARRSVHRSESPSALPQGGAALAAPGRR